MTQGAGERAIDDAARRRRGQHFTKPDPAALMAALGVRAPGGVILDPACGTGVLLQAAAARLGHLGGGGRLIGVEIDAHLVGAARESLPEATILQGDFLAPRRPPIPDRVDAVIANPPYVRQELIGARARSALARTPFAAPGRSDLHVAFWPRALDRLHPGGRICFLTSATWLDSAYGEALGRWLCEGFRVVAVIEPHAESWFDAARVRTCITVVDHMMPGADHAVRFVRLNAPLARLVPVNLPAARRLALFDDLARDLEQGRIGSHLATVREPPASRLAGGRWGASLRQPDLHFEILDTAGDRMVPLGEIATVRWGIKTGDDAFFFLRRSDPTPVERRFLVPVVFSLMELDRLVVEDDALRRFLVLAGTGDEKLAPRLRAWIRAAEHERRSHLRPTCAARARGGRAWFDLRPAAPGALLWSVMQQYRHLVPLNPGAFPVNDNLLQLDLHEGIPARLMAAILNSGVVALIKHGWGRQRNEGMLKTQACDVRALPVPDPRRIAPARAEAIVAAFDRIAARRIGSVTEEWARADRRALDRLVLAECGCGPAGAERTAGRIAEALAEIHARERLLERDAVARRRVPRAPGSPAAKVRGTAPPARTP